MATFMPIPAPQFSAPGDDMEISSERGDGVVQDDDIDVDADLTAERNEIDYNDLLVEDAISGDEGESHTMVLDTNKEDAIDNSEENNSMDIRDVDDGPVPEDVEIYDEELYDPQDLDGNDNHNFFEVGDYDVADAPRDGTDAGGVPLVTMTRHTLSGGPSLNHDTILSDPNHGGLEVTEYERSTDDQDAVYAELDSYPTNHAETRDVNRDETDTEYLRRASDNFRPEKQATKQVDDKDEGEEHTGANHEINNVVDVAFDIPFHVSEAHEEQTSSEVDRPGNPDPAVTNKEEQDPDALEDQRNDLHAIQPSTIPPILVAYGGDEIALFPPREDQDVRDYLLEDGDKITKPIKDILSDLREVFWNSISDEHEIHLAFDQLDLYISEDSIYAPQICLSHVVDVYVQLAQLDGDSTIPPLSISLDTTPRVPSRLKSIMQAANEGIGLSQLALSRDLDNQELIAGQEVPDAGCEVVIDRNEERQDLHVENSEGVDVVEAAPESERLESLRFSEANLLLPHGNAEPESNEQADRSNGTVASEPFSSSHLANVSMSEQQHPGRSKQATSDILVDPEEAAAQAMRPSTDRSDKALVPDDVTSKVDDREVQTMTDRNTQKHGQSTDERLNLYPNHEEQLRYDSDTIEYGEDDFDDKGPAEDVERSASWGASAGQDYVQRASQEAAGEHEAQTERLGESEPHVQTSDYVGKTVGRQDDETNHDADETGSIGSQRNIYANEQSENAKQDLNQSVLLLDATETASGVTETGKPMWNGDHGDKEGFSPSDIGLYEDYHDTDRLDDQQGMLHEFVQEQPYPVDDEDNEPQYTEIEAHPEPYAGNVQEPGLIDYSNIGESYDQGSNGLTDSGKDLPTLSSSPSTMKRSRAQLDGDELDEVSHQDLKRVRS